MTDEKLGRRHPSVISILKNIYDLKLNYENGFGSKLKESLRWTSLEI